MTRSASWFQVDHVGLGKLLERRGKVSALYELVSNAWDADGVSRVEVDVVAVPGVPHAEVTVTDDAPDGFAHLEHAWTLFAESRRKGDAGKRGRFNLGEKIVLSLCTQARIVTTRGAVAFDARGRRAIRDRREQGSQFHGILRATRSEIDDMVTGIRDVIAPPGVDLVVGGEGVPRRTPVGSFEVELTTEVADDAGVLRRRSRRCTVTAYDPPGGQPARIYELGIPIVETGDRWDLDVGQKVPLNFERDNVTPAYLASLRVACANHLRHLLREEDAAGPLSSDALASDAVEPDTVRRLLDLRYGERRAIWDPSDVEASMRLVSRGYALIRGGELNGPQWANVKKHAAAEPAGRIDPTPKAQFSPDGEDLWVPRGQWTPAMERVADHVVAVGTALLGRPVSVAILCGVHLRWGACFGEDRVTLNLGRLGHGFFDACLEQGGPTDRLHALVVHELGHAYSGNHLSDEFHDGLCELGARLARLAIDCPAMFRWSPGSTAARRDAG